MVLQVPTLRLPVSESESKPLRYTNDTSAGLSTEDWRPEKNSVSNTTSFRARGDDPGTQDT